jgi:hypothetical protein
MQEPRRKEGKRTMNRKIPPDAFGYYWSLGPERSYQAVADKYGTSKRAVTKVAAKENWSQRSMEIEKKAHEKTDEKLAESLDEMNGRHIKVCKLIQRKALETLKSMPLTTAIEAVRALDLAIKQERLVRGEPTDRSAVSVEDVIRREYDRWLVGVNSNRESFDEDGEGNHDAASNDKEAE